MPLRVRVMALCSLPINIRCLSELGIVMVGKDVMKVSVNLKQKVHCHDALVRGIVYEERLSVVEKFDGEGVVCLNNAHSLSLECD